ncbi:MAG: CRISPR-associated endonuclease Csy4 [Clostridiales bacterium]|jgi:CRISPR-associated endonuclease Csy4|nr:CRISPR-associated endonuclease Csy4 [Clostridiales bacterium]MDN5282786.1 CRISPR-associated endonuclease Csy4 [Candidatus Ozemobacter sp.]
MKFFQEITLLPGVEVGLYFLWKKVFQQLHLAFVEIKDHEDHVSVGISFPGYNSEKTGLGNLIRVFSFKEEDLQQLKLEKWFSSFSEYVSISPIRSVPNSILKGYAVFKRWQGKSSIERLARRRARRKNESLEQAMAYYSDYEEERVDLPFVQAKSLSGNREFRLIIKRELKPEPYMGTFNCYGLSLGEATVPIW